MKDANCSSCVVQRWMEKHPDITNKCTVSGSLRSVMHFCFHFIRGKGDTFNMKWISIMVSNQNQICVLCYCYSFVCVSVFILQVILHLWYKQVICKKKKPRKNSIPAVHWGKIGTWKCFSSHEKFFFSDKRLCIGGYLCHNTGPLYQRAK